VNLTTNLNLVPRLRARGATLPHVPHILVFYGVVEEKPVLVKVQINEVISALKKLARKGLKCQNTLWVLN